MGGKPPYNHISYDLPHKIYQAKRYGTKMLCLFLCTTYKMANLHTTIFKEAHRIVQLLLLDLVSIRI